MIQQNFWHHQWFKAWSIRNWWTLASNFHFWLLYQCPCVEAELSGIPKHKKVSYLCSLCILLMRCCSYAFCTANIAKLYRREQNFKLGKHWNLRSTMSICNRFHFHLVSYQSLKYHQFDQSYHHLDSNSSHASSIHSLALRISFLSWISFSLPWSATLQLWPISHQSPPA